MAALLHSCFDHQLMLMRRTQGRRSLLHIGPTSRTRDSAWFLFPCQDFDPVANLSKLIPRPTSYSRASPLPPASARGASVGPEEMFEANIVHTRFCFFATAASGRHELVIDRDGRFPLRIFLQQSRCVESGLVIPEQLAALTGRRLILQDLIERRQRAGSIAFFVEAQSLFKQRLVTPMNRPLLIGSQLVVGLNGTLITTWVCRASLEK